MDFQPAARFSNLRRTRVSCFSDSLHAVCGACLKPGHQLAPSQGRTVGESQLQNITGWPPAWGRLSSQASRREAIAREKERVEASQTSEAGAQGHIVHGQTRFLEKPLGEEQSLSLQYFDWSESESLLQQAPHLPAAETGQRGQFLNGIAVRRAAL